MFEWWQTLVLSLSSLAIGGLIALVSGFAQHRWSDASNRAAEDREDRRRAEETHGERRTRYRRERMKPVLDFLDVASAYVAGVDVTAVMDIPYDENVDDVQQKMSREEWQSSVAAGTEDPNVMDITRAAILASAAAPTKEMNDAIRVVVNSLPTTAKDTPDAFGGAVRFAHGVVERYLVD